MRRTTEKGQAIVLVLLALSLFFIGAIGLGIDASHLFAHRQMAQSAADAAAVAGIMSVFDKTNTAAYSNAFGSATIDCASGSNLTPCYYAKKNGFSPENGDTVRVDFPGTVPGAFLAADNPAVLRVTISRNVNSTLLKFVGKSLSTIRAQATAAITSIPNPVPILVLHPTRGDALLTKGTGSDDKIKICGGPQRSIQVNSCAGTGAPSCAVGQAVNWTGNPIIDLSKAGPADDGLCNTGTGGDFGNTGNPAAKPPILLLGSGSYITFASPITDPLINVPQPTDPGSPTVSPSPCNVGTTCPVGITDASVACPEPGNCKLFYPGAYNGVGNPAFPQIKNFTALFMPGLYYIKGGGFPFGSNGNARMAGNAAMSPTVCPSSDAATGCGMVVFMTGAGGVDIPANAGSGSGIHLLGPEFDSLYEAILFFRDRGAPAFNHSFQGGGSMTLIGTLYLTNDTKAGYPGTGYQSLEYGGGPGSSSFIKGQIIADTIYLHGNPNITMQIAPNTKTLRYVTLVR